MKDFCYHTNRNKHNKKGKLIIFSAPSGSGKSTIVNALLKKGFDLEFSISATSRLPRGAEQDGVEYYFLTPDAFRQKIEHEEFLEWEEVYTDTYYGTLKSEVERITSKGKNIVFDVDVVGGVNIKKMYGDRALSLFIQPPSIEELRNRLVGRSTDSEEKIAQRIGKAEEELSYAPKFDKTIVNDDLETAINETENVLSEFLKK
ncbi:guanylate kinase [Marinilabiliaceae bacterium JC017]|nr:guanylate kinase [Marinilabiliaceae bacterium JC017]